MLLLLFPSHASYEPRLTGAVLSRALRSVLIANALRVRFIPQHMPMTNCVPYECAGGGDQCHHCHKLSRAAPEKVSPVCAAWNAQQGPHAMPWNYRKIKNGGVSDVDLKRAAVGHDIFPWLLWRKEYDKAAAEGGIRNTEL